MLKPILLVEDNPRDLELTLLALERSQLANEALVASLRALPEVADAAADLRQQSDGNQRTSAERREQKSVAR